jgi:hypothetical protein
MWSFPYYGVPVYGTGFYYPPYYGVYYYPRPPTWGFHVGFNPWTGWHFGVSWGGPFMSFGVGWSSGWGGGFYHHGGCCGGWYGGGYHAHYSYSRSTSISVSNRVSVGNSYNNDRLRTSNVRNASRDNLYDRPETRARNADAATAASNLKKARPAAGKANDVFADKSGNIARQTKDGWQARGTNGWEKPEAANVRQQGGTAKPGQAPARIDSADLNRSAAARQRGSTRETSRPSSTRARSASRPAPRRR